VILILTPLFNKDPCSFTTVPSNKGTSGFSRQTWSLLITQEMWTLPKVIFLRQMLEAGEEPVFWAGHQLQHQAHSQSSFWLDICQQRAARSSDLNPTSEMD
jgi:hypothetical protein